MCLPNLQFTGLEQLASWAEKVKFTFHKGGLSPYAGLEMARLPAALPVVGLWGGFKPLSTKQYNSHFMCVYVCVCIYTYIERILLCVLC